MDDRNRFSYTQNSPTAFVDPSGLGKKGLVIQVFELLQDAASGIRFGRKGKRISKRRAIGIRREGGNVITNDGNGNRTSRTKDGVTETYTYDIGPLYPNGTGDLLLSIAGPNARSFSYDSAGRLRQVLSGSNTTWLSYDYDDNLTSILYPNGTTTTTFTYNGFGARVSKSTSNGGASFTYKRDGADVRSPVLSDGAAFYTPGISEKRSGQTRFFHPDRLGTYSQITNPAHGSVAKREYDAFGNKIRDVQGSTPTPWGYAGDWGYHEDTESGLQQVGHRYYDPNIGRFLTMDPVYFGRNWFAYCDSNPSGCLDPLGLMRIWDMEFTLEGVSEGLDTGLHGAMSGMTFGFYDGGTRPNRVGFRGSQVFGGIASSSLLGATSYAALPRATLIIAENGTIPPLAGQGAVIGNNMQRVRIAADVFRAESFRVGTAGKVAGWFKNLRWMAKQVRTKDFILDIGPVPGSRPYGPWYRMERVIVRLLCK